LNRFFSFHFLIPIFICALVFIHLIFLHQKGSSNPLGSNSNFDKTKFFPFFMVKDLNPIVFIIFFMFFLSINYPNILGDVENFNIARITLTPSHIQPEWYFLFAYAILRSIPSKLGGVVAIIISILVMVFLTIKVSNVNKKFLPFSKFLF
jgi:ubiquinol-cytochrome c reductase cytochrome b subunit